MQPRAVQLYMDDVGHLVTDYCVQHSRRPLLAMLTQLVLLKPEIEREKRGTNFLQSNIYILYVCMSVRAGPLKWVLLNEHICVFSTDVVEQPVRSERVSPW